MTTPALVQRGILLGCEAVAQSTPDGTINVGSGQQLFDNTVVAVAGNSAYDILTGHPADASLPRWDLVWLDSAGTLNTTVGTPTDYDAVGAVARPNLPSTANPVCSVFVPAAATTITADQVVDERVLLTYPAVAQAFSYTFVAGNLSLADPGSGAFGFDLANLSLAHLYLSYTSPTSSHTVKGWAQLLVGRYLLISARSDPGMWLLISVSGFTDHSTYCDLACASVSAWTVAINPISAFTTVPLDSVLQVLDVVPTPGTWTLVKKAANTARSSNTTLTADPDLQVAVAASTNYIFRGLIRFDSSSTTPDIKFDFDGPASPTRVTVQVWSGDAGVAPAFLTPSGFNTTVTQQAGAISSTPGIIGFEVILENGSTAGTFSFRWAQNTTSSSATNVRAGSHLEWTTF